MGVDAEWLLQNGGYDERFYGWGCEDDELIHRVMKAGFRRIMLSTTPVHLWHEHFLQRAQETGACDVQTMLSVTQSLYREATK
jgi:predicted glycosyltransferase involved in capsule biosynthesis